MTKPMPSGPASGERYLLDTAVVLWALALPERLTPRARKTILGAECTLSVASYWEVAIKARRGLLPIGDAATWWERASELFAGKVLSIRASHVSALTRLPDLHRDPFDRILIAQAVAEGMTLLTSDEQIAAYPVRVMWK